MAKLDAITADLRRQRRDLERMLDEAAARCDETSKLVERIEHLRGRTERVREKKPATEK